MVSFKEQGIYQSCQQEVELDLTLCCKDNIDAGEIHLVGQLHSKEGNLFFFIQMDGRNSKCDLSYLEVEKKFWIEMVKAVDTNGDQCLSKLEFEALLETLGSSVTDSELNALVSRHYKRSVLSNITCLEDNNLS